MKHVYVYVKSWASNTTWTSFLGNTGKSIQINSFIIPHNEKKKEKKELREIHLANEEITS